MDFAEVCSDGTASRELSALSEPVPCIPGGFIYRAGEPAVYIYEILDGVVKMIEGTRGKNGIAAFLFPRDLFGCRWNGRYRRSAAVSGPLRLRRIAIAGLARMTNPALALYVRCKLEREREESDRHEALLAHAEAAPRAAGFLVMLQHAARLQGRDEQCLDLPMRWCEIADYAGLSRATLSGAFIELERNGLIERPGYRRVRILDGAAIRVLAHSPAAALLPPASAPRIGADGGDAHDLEHGGTGNAGGARGGVPRRVGVRLEPHDFEPHDGTAARP